MYISFHVSSGQNVAVIGESGSGKSTLLKLLYGEYDLDDGFISWDGEKILGPKFNLITGPDFMKHVAQEFDLMPYTSVETNIGNFLSNLYPEKKQQRIMKLIYLSNSLKGCSIRGVHFNERVSNDVFCIQEYKEND